MLNTETVIHPKLQHLGLTTGNLQPLLAWYKTVLGMRLIYLSENPIGAPADSTPSIKAVWLSNDEANHRIAVVEISGSSPTPSAPAVSGCSTLPSHTAHSTILRAPQAGRSPLGKRPWRAARSRVTRIRHKRPGKETEIPVHTSWRELLDQYLAISGLRNWPTAALFPIAVGKTRKLGNRPVTRIDAARMPPAVRRPQAHSR